jgi:hypothetical protein
MPNKKRPLIARSGGVLHLVRQVWIWGDRAISATRVGKYRVHQQIHNP